MIPSAKRPPRRRSGKEDAVRIVQRINHNAALCIDGDGREVIALGKGVCPFAAVLTFLD